MNNINFKYFFKKGAKGDKGDTGTSYEVPTGAIVAYDGNDTPEGYEDTVAPQFGAVSFADVTKAQFDNMSEPEKNNNTIYYVIGGGTTQIEADAIPRIDSDNGRMTASSTQNNSYAPWYAINNVIGSYVPDTRTRSSCWRPSRSIDPTSAWLRYHFSSAKYMKKITFTAWDFLDKTFSVEVRGSNDGSSWTNIVSGGGAKHF